MARRGALLGAASAQARANGDNLGQESDQSDRHDDRALVPIEHGPGYSLCPTRERRDHLPSELQNGAPRGRLTRRNFADAVLVTRMEGETR
jgi:hypothetical protein